MPIKGYSFELKVPDSLIEQQKGVKYTDKIHLKFAQKGIVSSYLQNNTIRVSGFGDIAGLDTKLDDGRIEYLKRLAAEMYGPELIRGAYNEWCGLRPCMPDDKPVIGPLKRHSNLIINTGHGGRGLTQGIATSKIAAQLVDFNKEAYQKSEIT